MGNHEWDFLRSPLKLIHTRWIIYIYIYIWVRRMFLDEEEGSNMRRREIHYPIII